MEHLRPRLTKALNPALQLSARVAEESSEQKVRRAGADFVFAPYHSTGHRMAQAIARPHVPQFLEFTTTSMGLDVAIEQVLVDGNSPFAGRTLAETQVRQETGVIVSAIRAEGEMLFRPPGDARISGGDHLIAMGEPQGLRRLAQLVTGVAA